VIDPDLRAPDAVDGGVSTFTAILTPPRGTTVPQTRREALAAEEEALRHVRVRTPKERAPKQRTPKERAPKQRSPRRIAWIVVSLVALLLLAGGGLAGAYAVWPTQVKTLFGWSNDYTGTGTGSVEITIKPGDLGSDVAATLAAADVTKTRAAFYDLLVKMKPEPPLQPGTYRLAHHMSAAAALRALQDPAHLVVASVTLPEGTTVAQSLVAIAKATGVSLDDLKAAAKDYRSLGVPKAAPSLEGYLFPATYQFQPNTSAKAMLQAMVKRMYQALDAAGVPVADRHRVLTLAGIVQKEGNGADDAKVARVFLNRLKKGMLLQSDATVTYGAGGSTVVPTTKQYAAKNPYNTNLRKGLPIGPISNPGDQAIRATVHPAAGPWLFFVTVNLQTGETVFSTTDKQHEKAAAQFRRWLRAHPTYGK
jgi:UPF0755 protein